MQNNDLLLLAQAVTAASVGCIIGAVTVALAGPWVLALVERYWEWVERKTRGAGR